MTNLTAAEEALVRREHFTDERRLIEALHPLAARWSENVLGGWIFRGQWCSTWDLVPSLYRKEKIEAFLPGRKPGRTTLSKGLKGSHRWRWIS